MNFSIFPIYPLNPKSIQPGLPDSNVGFWPHSPTSRPYSYPCKVEGNPRKGHRYNEGLVPGRCINRVLCQFQGVSKHKSVGKLFVRVRNLIAPQSDASSTTYGCKSSKASTCLKAGGLSASFLYQVRAPGILEGPEIMGPFTTTTLWAPLD